MVVLTAQRTVPSIPLPPLGARVEVIYDRRKLTGTVRFAGVTAFASGSLVGVALDSPVGKNDGSVMGARYFDCAPNHGLFIRPKAIVAVEPPEDMSIAQVYNPEWSGMRLSPEPGKPPRRRVKALRVVKKADQSMKSSTPGSKADWIDDELEGQTTLTPSMLDRSWQDEALNKEGALKSPMSYSMDEQKESRATRMQSRGLESFFSAIGRVTPDVEDRAEQWFEDQGAESFTDILEYGLEDSFTNALNLKIVQQRKASAFWDKQAAAREGKPVASRNGRQAQLDSSQKADQKPRQISAGSGRAKASEGSDSERAKMMAEILAPVLESNGFTQAAMTDIVSGKRSGQNTVAAIKNPDWIRVLNDIHATMAQLAESAANAEIQAAAAATAAAESECRISEAMKTAAGGLPNPPEVWMRTVVDRIDRCDASARESARLANEACERLQRRFEEILAAADRDEPPSPGPYLSEETFSWPVASQERAPPARWPQATPSFTPPVRAATPQMYSDDELSPFYSSGLRDPMSPSSPNAAFSPLVVPLSPQADIRVLAPEGLESVQNRVISSKSPPPILAMPVSMTAPAPASVIELPGNPSFPGISGSSAPSSLSTVASFAADAQVPTVGMVKIEKPEAGERKAATFGLPLASVAEGANSSAMFGTPTPQATSVSVEASYVARCVPVVRDTPAARAESQPTATVGLDLNNNGKADVVITGEDANRDGIPDVLQQGASPLVATVGLDLNNNGKADVIVSGPDLNGDGIPDFLQQSTAPLGQDTSPTPLATVSLDLNGNGQADVVITGEDRDRDGIPDVLQQSTSLLGQDASPPVATVSLDLNNDGQANVEITGPDLNRDGIPDFLQQSSAPLGQDTGPPLATVSLDLNGNGQADVVITGEDRDRDGIPDALQQSTSPLVQDATPPVATVSLDLNGNGQADVVITGEDRDRDGIPDVLQQSTVGFDLNGNGQADVVITGEDRDRDGIPDALQQSAPPLGIDASPPVASVGLDLNGNGQADVVITGEDRDNDGVPDVLQQSTSPPDAKPPVASVSLDVGNAGKAVVITSEDRDRDGIANVLQDASPTVATVSLDLDGDGKADVVITGENRDGDGIPDVLQNQGIVGDGVGLRLSEDAAAKSIQNRVRQRQAKKRVEVKRQEKAKVEAKRLAEAKAVPEAATQIAFAFEHLDYDKVMASPELSQALKGKVVESIASNVKMSSNAIEVEFARGSVLVSATVRCAHEDAAKDVKKQIEADGASLLEAVDKSARQIPRITDAIVAGKVGLGASGIKANLKQPKTPEVSAPSAIPRPFETEVMCSSPMEVQRGTSVQSRFLVLYNDRCDEFEKAKDHLKGAAPLTSIDLTCIESFEFIDGGFSLTFNGVEMVCRTSDAGSLARWTNAWHKLLEIDVDNDEEQPQEILHEGPLGVVKKGGVTRQHFEVFANRFEYYSSKEAFSAGQKPTGRLPFADVTDFILNAQNCGFAIYVEEGKMHLQCQSTEEYKAWKSVWIEVLKKARPDLPFLKELLSRESRESEWGEQYPVFFQGYLSVMKKSELQPRYFVLFNNRVEYWNSPNDFTQRLKSRGQIRVQDVSDVKILDDGFAFMLKQGLVQLKTNSAADLESWVAHLERIFRVVKDVKPDKFTSNDSSQVESNAQDTVEQPSSQGQASPVCQGVLGYEVTGIGKSNTVLDLSAVGDASRTGCPMMIEKAEEFEALAGAKGFILGTPTAELELRVLDSNGYSRWKEAWQSLLDFEEEFDDSANMLAEVDDEIEATVHQGSLAVMKRDNVAWKHFALFTDRLSYYTSAADFAAGAQPSGHVKLAEIKEFTANDDNVVFMICVEGESEDKFRKIALQAEDQQKYFEWKRKWATVMRTISPEVSRSLGPADAEEHLLQGHMYLVKGGSGGSEQRFHFVLFKDRLEYFASSIDYTHGLQPVGQIVKSNVTELRVVESGFQFATNEGGVQLTIEEGRIIEWAMHLAWVFPCFTGDSRTGRLGGMLAVLKGNDAQQRHFVIFDDRLEYYTSSEDCYNSLKPRGQLVFRTLVNTKVIGKELHFISPTGVVVLRTPGSRELARWKAELSKLITVIDQEPHNRVHKLPPHVKTRYFVLYKDRLENFVDEHEFNKVRNSGKVSWKEDSNTAETDVVAAGAPLKNQQEEKEKSPPQAAASDRNVSFSADSNPGAAKTIFMKGPMCVDKEGVLQNRYFVLYKNTIEYWKSVEDYERGQAPRGNLSFETFKECTCFKDGFKFSSAEGSVTVRSQGGESFTKWKEGLLKAGVLKSGSIPRSTQQQVICEGVLGVPRSSAVSLRYFALYTDRLDYYNDTDITDIEQSQPDGRIHLSDIVTHKISDTEFKLQLSSGTLVLQPQSSTDVEKWRNALSQVLGGMPATSSDAPQRQPSARELAAQRARLGTSEQETPVVAQPASLSPSTLICEGTLGVNKQGTTESRYFRLTVEHLDYFLNKEACRRGETQRGRVVLDDVEDLNYGSSDFTLVLPQGSMQLIANGKADFEKWKDAWNQIFEVG